MKKTTEKIFEQFLTRYPFMNPVREEIVFATNQIIACYQNNGKLLVCGNGGSNADADHIAGELMKGFVKQRKIETQIAKKMEQFGAKNMIEKLQGALPVINLGAHTSLLTAVANDIGGEMIFAQQVLGFGQKGDLLLGISTSGNSKDIICAGLVAKAKEMKTILLSGKDGGEAKEVFDFPLLVPDCQTADVQSMHSAVYHAVCMMVENEFWDI